MPRNRAKRDAKTGGAPSEPVPLQAAAAQAAMRSAGHFAVPPAGYAAKSRKARCKNRRSDERAGTPVRFTRKGGADVKNS